jgi:hypothetical protein
MNDRLNAIEGQSVRLYLRNYVSNVLTDATGAVTAIIREQTGTSTLETLTATRESRGVYYVEWAIPTSNVESAKYRSSFPGSGYYQDIWTLDGDTYSQDFFVFPEGYDSLVATTVSPLKFDYIFNTPRLEKGAKDYLSITLNEIDGKLVNTEDTFPEGEIQLIKGTETVFNYDDLIHQSTSSEYLYFLNTESLDSGVYKVQLKHTVPATTRNSKAIVTTTKTLNNGFTPSSSDSKLELVVDGIRQNVLFPSTADKARITTVFTEPLSFFDVSNDLFVVEVNGTEQERRLLNTPEPRGIDDIVDELNGTFPSGLASPATAFGGATAATYPSTSPGLQLALPMVTATNDYTEALADQLWGDDLSFTIDGTTYSVVFTGSTANTRDDIIDQINAEVGEDVAGYVTGTKTVFFITKSGASSIEIVGGDAADKLGFFAGQADINPSGLGAGVASVEASSPEVIKLTGTTSLRILTQSEGSVANEDLGFDTTGTIVEKTEDTAATITGSIINLLSVVNPYEATITTENSVNDNLANVTTIDGDSLTLDADMTSFTVPFADNVDSGAITSGFFTQAFSFINGTNDTLELDYVNNAVTVSKTIDFTGSPSETLDINDVISAINTELASGTDISDKVIADSYQGRLRIRMRKVDGDTGIVDQSLRIVKAESTAFDILGFEGIVDSPEPVFRNDQVTEDESSPGIGDLVAVDYINAPTATDIVNQINADATASTYVVASLLTDDRISITALNPPTTTTLTASFSSPNNADDYLDFTALSSTRETGQNFDIVITVDGGDAQTVSFADGSRNTDYFVQQINAQAVGVIAENDTNRIKISHQTAGSGNTFSLSDSSGGTTLTTLGLDGSVTAGTDGTAPTITATSAPASTFVSTQNGVLKIKAVETDPFTEIELGSDEDTGAEVATLISAISGITASYDAGTSTLTIESDLAGSDNGFIRIGSLNEGSTANTVLNISTDGAESVGSDGTPYTINQVKDRINNVFGGELVAENSSNFIRMSSLATGADASLEIGEKTTTDVLTDWGLVVGKTLGTSTTQVAQIIVSPRLTLTVGE